MSRLVINRIVNAFCFILIPPFLSVADIQRFLQIVRKSTGDPDDGSGFLIICEKHKQRQENTPGHLLLFRFYAAVGLPADPDDITQVLL